MRITGLPHSQTPRRLGQRWAPGWAKDRQPSRNPLWLSASLLLAAGILLSSAASASAQDNASPFGFIKPWIEQRLFGERPPAPSEEPAGEPAAADGIDGSPPAAAPAGEAEPAVADDVVAPSQQPREAEAEPESAPAVGTAAAPAAEADAAAGATPAGALSGEPDALGRILREAAEKRPQPLRFAVLAGRRIATTMTLMLPVAEALGRILDRPVEIVPMSSYAAMIDAQDQRRIDGGFYSAAAFARAEAQCNCLEALVAPRAFDGTLAYYAIIVARRGSSVETVADLAGRTVAVAAADSIGARRVQLAGLMAEGIDPARDFGAIIGAESAADAVRLVDAGAADAAFAWSSLSGDLASGYSRGTLADLAAAGALDLSTVTIIWRSPEIGHGPFAVAKTLPDEEKTRIRDYLLALEDANPAAYDILSPFYAGGYAPAEARLYAALDLLTAHDVDALTLSEVPAALRFPPAIALDDEAAPVTE